MPHELLQRIRRQLLGVNCGEGSPQNVETVDVTSRRVLEPRRSYVRRAALMSRTAITG